MSESQQESRPNLRKTRVGVVVSNKMNKTLVVEHIARVPHPKFKKIIKRSKKYYVHDENGAAAIGDKGRIVETTRDFSRELGSLVGGRLRLPVPSMIIEQIFGDGATVILDGQRVTSARLQEAGFRFRHPDLREALASIL